MAGLTASRAAVCSGAVENPIPTPTITIPAISAGFDDIAPMVSTAVPATIDHSRDHGEGAAPAIAERPPSRVEHQHAERQARQGKPDLATRPPFMIEDHGDDQDHQ